MAIRKLELYPRAVRGLGDWVERVVKPAAVALGNPCLEGPDERGERRLKAGSPCAERRDRLNALGRKVGLPG